MEKSNRQIITRLMFRLLPIQILLPLVNSINGLVSSYYASNYVGIDAMSAVGLYGPLNMLYGAIGTVLSGGCLILCGKYLGRNENDRLQDLFTLDLAVSSVTAFVSVGLYVMMAVSDLTGIFTADANVRPLFNGYLLGQAIGLFPQIIASQLPCFLSIENRGGRTTAASIAYVFVNIILNHIFVKVMGLEAFGLSLASSVGMWIFMLIQLQYYMSGNSLLKLRLSGISWKTAGEVVKIGFPGAASFIYQTARGLILNKLLEKYTGAAGISAFAAANNVMGPLWAIPAGMSAVSRLLISVSIGEEDRQTLTDIMRVMMYRYIPLMLVIDAGVIAAAPALSSIFFSRTAEPVYSMMVSGLRILPLCMAFSIICMHFTCYGQASGKQVYVNMLAMLDGVVSVAGFTALLIKPLGINAAYIANVLNGVVTTAYICLYSWYHRKHFPRNMDDLMVIPDDFGAPEEDRIDISVRSMDEVVKLSQQIQEFCRDKGIDSKRSYLAALCMEEMAGNVVSHGFGKDSRDHSVDIRVVRKNDDVILRIRDDCVPFDPKERSSMLNGGDPARNMGIRMVYSIAEDITYQNMLGLNVLTIRI